VLDSARNDNEEMDDSLGKNSPRWLHPAANALTLILPTFFLAYCCIYLCACPSPALATAVGGELLAFGISLAVFKARIFTLPKGLLAKLPERLKDWLACSRALLDYAKVSVLSIILFLALTDFAALCFSVAGNYQIGATIYRLCPSTYWLGLHPAFSLEMLAGAFVQSKNFKQAEPLYLEILDIRTKLCGADSDLASAIYADLGDFYVRSGDMGKAEHWYRRSIEIGPRTGRGFTALATLLRESGRYAESREYYLKALELRQKVFGADSKQYRDTERGYQRLQEIINAQKSRKQ
jgi:tetratricopeptide (TPR) repeat protein